MIKLHISKNSRKPVVGALSKIESPVIGEWSIKKYPSESTTDWIAVDRAVALSHPLKPYYGEEIWATTPLIMWPDKGATHTWQVRIYDSANQVVATVNSDLGQNFAQVPLASALLPGKVYSWSVKSLITPETYPWSSPRYFFVSSSATGYSVDVPGFGASLGQRIWDRVLGLNGQPGIAHPRCIPTDSAILANIAKAFNFLDKRNPGVLQTESTLVAMEAETIKNENTVVDNSTFSGDVTRCWSLYYYWKLGGRYATRARDEFKRRIISYTTYWDGVSLGTKLGYGTQAGVPQTGAKSDYLVQDQNCRSLIILLAMGYDAFKVGAGSGTDLTLAEQTRLLQYVDYRLNQIKVSIYDARTDKYDQYDSHGMNNIGFAGFTSMLLAETDMSSFPTTYNLAANITLLGKDFSSGWLRTMESFRCDDGSSNRGMGYDMFDNIYVQFMLLSYYMYGIDLTDKPLFYNTTKWRLYSNTRPGDHGLQQFGDGSEDPIYSYSYMINAFFKPSTATAYLYNSCNPWEYMSAFATYMPMRDGGWPAIEEPNLYSMVFPTGGYYMSHSEYSNPLRTSVYTRSAPYGSHNHAHYDNGSLIVWGKGKQLIIDAGYYDTYGGGHWGNWYKSPLAHNLITFDYGIGHQLFSPIDSTNVSRAAKGEIVCWKEALDYSYVVMDVTPAYSASAYKTKSCLRSVVHLRPDVVLTFDYVNFESSSHIVDWNWHTKNPILYSGQPNGTGTYTITDGSATLDIRNEYCNVALSSSSAWSSGVRTNNYNYTGWDGALGFDGIATSSTNNSLTISSAPWTVNKWAGCYVKMTSGPASGQSAMVASNTASTLTLSSNLSSTPGQTDSFSILQYNAPNPAESGPAQYHHRYCTSSATNVYKAVTSCVVGGNSSLSTVSTVDTGDTLIYNLTYGGVAKTIRFNYLSRTITIN